MRCETGTAKTDTVATLFNSWKTFAERNGEDPGTSKTFSQAMGKAGFDAVKNTPGQHGKRGFKGVSVAPRNTEAQWQNQGDR